MHRDVSLSASWPPGLSSCCTSGSSYEAGCSVGMRGMPEHSRNYADRTLMKEAASTQPTAVVRRWLTTRTTGQSTERNA